MSLPSAQPAVPIPG